MAKPTLTGQPGNILVSAAVLILNGVDIGFASGIKIKGKEETTPVTTDQLGKTVINHFHVGDSWSVECHLDELTAAQLKKAFPQGKLMSSGGVSRISWGKPIGSDYFSLAQTLEVKPTADDVNYKGRNFKFYKAVPMGDSEIEEKPDGKAVIKVTFHCYPDLTQAAGEFYGFFGDPAAGAITPASAASAVAGGSNVGNGTISAIVVNDTFTKSETWTLTCIHAATNSGIFSVVGSVTGARGNATVGSTYTSNTITPGNSEIQLLINDGTTDFAIGDTFSIVTTAKLYT